MQHCDRLIKTVLRVGTAGDREIHFAPLAGCARLVYRQRGQRGYETGDKAAQWQVPDRFHDEVLSVSGSHPPMQAAPWDVPFHILLRGSSSGLTYSRPHGPTVLI